MNPAKLFPIMKFQLSSAPLPLSFLPGNTPKSGSVQSSLYSVPKVTGEKRVMLADFNTGISPKLSRNLPMLLSNFRLYFPGQFSLLPSKMIAS